MLFVSRGRVAACALAVCLLPWALVRAGMCDSVPEAAGRLGVARELKRAGKGSEALAVVEKVPLSSPDGLEALWLRAWLHAELGHREQARRAFAQLVQLAPDGPHVAEARSAIERLSSAGPRPVAKASPAGGESPVLNGAPETGAGVALNGASLASAEPASRPKGSPAVQHSTTPARRRTSAVGAVPSPGRTAPLAQQASPTATASPRPSPGRAPASASARPASGTAPAGAEAPTGQVARAGVGPTKGEARAFSPGVADAGGPAVAMVGPGPDGLSAGKTAAELESEYFAAEQSLRRRDFRGAARLLQGIVQASPGFRGGRACARLMRALFLSNDCGRAIALAEPLRKHWEADSDARRQMALCRYAVEYTRGLPLDRVPRCVADAFGVSEADYPASDPLVQQVASRIGAGGANDREKARGAFDWIACHCRYDESLIGQTRRDVLTVLRTGRGVCTDFARLYVTLCRGAGVPARLVTGECRTGAHAWAQVWIVGKGWMPVDATRGIRGRPFGRLDSDVHADKWQRENW